MRTFLLPVLLLIFIAAAHAQHGSYPTTSGDYVQRIAVDGQERSYLLHIPTGYDGTSEMPLLLAYHDYGDEPANFARATNFDLLGDQFGVIVAFPAGSGEPVLGWATVAELPEGTADSVVFTAQMIEEISANLAVDRDRIFAAGFSNGGGMVHRLACDLPDMFNAIAIVGGVHGKDQPCETDIPTPVYAIHGRYDTTAPYSGGENLMSIPQWIREWANRDGCTTPEVADKTESLLTVEWRDCADNTLVRLVTAEGIEHQWVNGMTSLI